MKKVKKQYIDEALGEKWKTVFSEMPTEIEWDEDLQIFRCQNSLGEYFCSFKEFFDKHVIMSNECNWKMPFDENSLKMKSIASWLCLINGHNLYEDNKRVVHKVKNRKKGSESSHLNHYIKDRYEDAVYSLSNGSAPDWVMDYILDDVEMTI